MSSSSSSQPNLKSGTVYKKIGDFLCSNPTLDADPAPIKSDNTITNPYTNKKKRRYIDMIGDSLYPSLSNTITGKCYNKLRKLENEMDVSITKRHSYISNQLQQTNNTPYDHNITRILRLELFNTFHINPENQNKNNKWIFKLQTKLFNPNNMSQPITYENNPIEYYYYNPLQTIISRIQFKLDKTALNDNTENNETEIEWNNSNWNHHSEQKQFIANSDPLMDGIQIERYGNKNCSVDIYIYLLNWFIPFERNKNNKNKKRKPVIHDNHNALCKVSHALSLLLGLGLLSHANGAHKGYERYHTKSEILQCLGYYIRQHKLLRNDHSMAIDCNQPLENLISAKTIYSANLWRILVMKKHVLSPDPIHIKHEICVSGNIEQNAKVYDILVKVPSLVAMKASKLMEPTHDIFNMNEDYNSYALTIDSLNVQISDVLEEINDQTNEKNLYQQYSNDPVSTIDVIVSNQRENLQIIREFCQNANVKPSQYFENSCVYNDIKRYLKKRQIEKQQDDDTNDNHNH